MENPKKDSVFVHEDIEKWPEKTTLNCILYSNWGHLKFYLLSGGIVQKNYAFEVPMKIGDFHDFENYRIKRFIIVNT
jgi:hypothetical protein